MFSALPGCYFFEPLIRLLKIQRSRPSTVPRKIVRGLLHAIRSVNPVTDAGNRAQRLCDRRELAVNRDLTATLGALDLLRVTLRSILGALLIRKFPRVNERNAYRLVADLDFSPKQSIAVRHTGAAGRALLLNPRWPGRHCGVALVTAG